MQLLEGEIMQVAMVEIVGLTNQLIVGLEKTQEANKKHY